jgi:cell division septation protein DedD
MNEATTRVDEWRNKGYPAFMMIADIPDRGRWYRVRIGGFSTKEDAQAYLDKFKQTESTEAIIVFNEQ